MLPHSARKMKNRRSFSTKGQVTTSCGYRNQDIHKAVYGGLLDEAPEVVAFLRRMYLGTKQISQLAAYMDENQLDPNQTAIYYLKNYEAQWTTWVPVEVAEQVKASLP
jgi:glycine betaine/proline transport system substrate-binding protein